MGAMMGAQPSRGRGGDKYTATASRCRLGKTNLAARAAIDSRICVVRAQGGDDPPFHVDVAARGRKRANE